jgi:hypothetical protein
VAKLSHDEIAQELEPIEEKNVLPEEFFLSDEEFFLSDEEFFLSDEEFFNLEEEAKSQKYNDLLLNYWDDVIDSGWW